MARDDERWQDHLDTATRSASGSRRDLEAAEFPALTILAHPDPLRVGEQAVFPGLASGQRVAVSRLEPRFAQPGRGPARPLADSRLSRQPWHLAPGSDGGIVLDPESGRPVLGAGGSPVTHPRLVTPEELHRGLALTVGRHLALLLHTVETRPPVGPIPGLIGESAAMRRVAGEIRRVADLDVAVLLRGESGTGKELVARALHDAGARHVQPYLAVNVAAIPPTLAAAELFGAVKGAYSGADRRRHGYFHRADGGTLFLDEIGEAPPEVQVMLLRVLETGQILSVGADAPQTVDVRVISATDVDLEAAVERGGFRLPLLHRLAGYEITLPALRERREDFGRLFFHVLTEELDALGESHRLCAAGPDETPWVDAEVVARLADYGWPGNVRQLRNVARQLVIGSRGATRMELAPKIGKLLETPPPDSEVPPRPQRSADAFRDPDQVGEAELRAVLTRHRFEPTPAAEELGVSRASLYNLMARHGIRKAADLGRDEIERCQRQHGGDVEAMAGGLEVSKRGLKIRMKAFGLR